MSVKCEQPLDELTVQISGTELHMDKRINRQTDELNTTCPCVINASNGITYLKFIWLFSALQPVTLTLAIIGKIGSAGAFAVIYVFSAELFPTVVRNAGMGASSCIARIGGMLAPYVASSVSISPSVGFMLPTPHGKREFVMSLGKKYNMRKNECFSIYTINIRWMRE